MPLIRLLKRAKRTLYALKTEVTFRKWKASAPAKILSDFLN